MSRRNDGATVTEINNNTTVSPQMCTLTLKSLYNDYKEKINCHILPQLTKTLPSSFININDFPIPSGLCLADSSFNEPSTIDILVGAHIFWSVLGKNSIDLGKNLPKLYETKLGWLVSGYVARSNQCNSSSICNFLNQESNPDLSRFWDLDTIAAQYSLSPEERACEQHFLANTSRNNDGRFMVSMPLKKDPSVLGESYHKAKYRFYH